jgi:hypothetical protein
MRFLESRLSGRLSYFGLCRHRVATENYFYTDGQARLPRGIGIERLRDPRAEWSRQFESLGLNPE